MLGVCSNKRAYALYRTTWRLLRSGSSSPMRKLVSVPWMRRPKRGIIGYGLGSGTGASNALAFKRPAPIPQAVDTGYLVT